MPIGNDADITKLLSSAPAGDTPARQREKLKKATQAFESVFVGQMLKQVRKSMEGTQSLLGSSSESKIYREMMDEAMANRISETGSFGLGRTLYQRLEPLLGLPAEALTRNALTPQNAPEKSAPKREANL